MTITRMNPLRTMKSNESGMVLIVVVGFSALAAIMAAGLYGAGNSHLISTHRAIRLEKAFYTAEAGIERAKAVLKASQDGLNDELVGSDSLTNTADDGIPDFGSSFPFGGGTYQVRIRDNADSDASLYVDTDNTVIILSTGTFQNVTRVIEAAVCLEDSLLSPQDVDSPFAIYGTNAEIELKGDALIDWHDYQVPADFDCSGAGCTGTLIPTNPALPGILSATTTTVTTVSSPAVIDGDPPIQIGTNTHTEQDWYDMVDALLPLATITIAGGVIGGNVTLGTRDNPEITVITGNAKITGNVDGAGFLLIMGGVEIDFTGTFHYEGIIILAGDNIDDAPIEFNDKGNASIFGAIVCVGGELDMKPQGSPAIMYSSEALANLDKITLPPVGLSTVYWREIK